MPDRLDQAIVDSSLQALPEWTGDTLSISRTVPVTPDEADRLVASLDESARAMNHDPEVERGDGELRIVLTTHSAGGVTALDIAMASHINDLVAQATGGPAEHVHHAAPEPSEDVDVSAEPHAGAEPLVQRGIRRMPI